MTTTEIISSKRKIVSNDTLEPGVKVPAALNLPFGQMFFGFNVTAYTPPSPTDPPESPEQVIKILSVTCLS
jgi:ubiquitin fusion degradation protein 1